MYMSPCDSSSYRDEIAYQMVMDKYSTKAMNAIGAVCSPYFGVEFGKLLAYGLKEGSEEAELICQNLGIGEKEMAALICDKEWFSEAIYG